MASWNATEGTITAYPDKPYPDYPGWLIVDCGCCNGLEWGGEEPRECRDCNGRGWVAVHKASRVAALYPGGPFCGRWFPPDQR